jgi:hypothetical protein
MGCASSSTAGQVVDGPKTPSYDELCQQAVVTDEKEPRLWSLSDVVVDVESDGIGTTDFINYDQAMSLIYRKVGLSNKGDAFQLEGLDDKLWNNIVVSPATKDVVNVKKRLEKMVYVHFDDRKDAKTKRTDNSLNLPLCYAVKNVPCGLNHYLLLSTKPIFDGQQPSHFVPSLSAFSNQNTYTWASVEFDVKKKVGHIKTVYHPKSQQPLPSDPRYTFYQTNPNVWIIKKLDETICGAINQWKGITKTSTCYRLVVCKGEDPIFVALMAGIIDDFVLNVAPTQGWKMYPNGATKHNIDFPPLPEGMDDKLFGGKPKV